MSKLYYIDRKVSMRERCYFYAWSDKEAKQLIDNNEDIGFNSVEALEDTTEAITEEENQGNPVVELYNIKGKQLI